ncbi:MAG: PadR family transcriptional regulator [Terriglobales bacterium]
MAPDTLGELEHLILLAVQGIGEKNCYGVTIFGALRKAERPTSLGAIYATLDRLEAKGYVTSWFGDPSPIRGGRAKKFFRIQGLGREALNQAERSIRHLRSLVPAAIVAPTPNTGRRGK